MVQLGRDHLQSSSSLAMDCTVVIQLSKHMHTSVYGTHNVHQHSNIDMKEFSSVNKTTRLSSNIWAYFVWTRI